MVCGTWSALLLGACASSTEVMAPRSAVPTLPGVDSTVVVQASELAASSFALDPVRAAEAREEGRATMRLVDSLLNDPTLEHLRPPTDSSTVRGDATARFNAGADALESLARADTIQAALLLRQAAEHFEEALRLDAFDEETRYWLARVYQMLADHYGSIDAVDRRVRILKRLVAMHQNRHDYVALLGEAVEQLGTREAGVQSGALWERAAQIAQDDADLDPGPDASVDSAAVFAYYVRAMRAFVQGGRSLLASAALDQADQWARNANERILLGEERAWLRWDGGNLATRQRYDELLIMMQSHPAEAALGFADLLSRVGTPTARLDTEHQLALAWYATDRHGDAIDRIRGLIDRAIGDQLARIRDDYAVMAYNLAQEERRAGNLTAALAYLLQSEQSGASIAPLAAYDAAILLVNNPVAALDRAHVADAGIDQLDPERQVDLLRYMAELYRRTGDRDRARIYVERLAAR